jgi:hypothetical protein
VKEAFSFDVYRSFDPDLWMCNEPAIMGTYSAERDPSVLTMPADTKPTKFRCRVLTRDQRRLVDDSSSANGKRMLAFRYGLVEIVDVAQGDGTFKTFVPNRSSPKDPLAPNALDAIEELGFGDRDMWDVGAAIMARSFLARGVPQRCELPDSSLHACGLMLSRRAERLTGVQTQAVVSSASAQTSDAAAAPQDPKP